MTTDVSISTLAHAAGLEADWTDAGGIARRVDDRALAALVDALGWPCGTAAQRVDSAAARAGGPPAGPRGGAGAAGRPRPLPARRAPPGARG
ncbi:4-alpha-glucanotransferase, partial [Burkholderia cepacia]|nr:4-alpha-glucanotransferase [Burkholderia cepacia]